MTVNTNKNDDREEWLHQKMRCSAVFLFQERKSCANNTRVIGQYVYFEWLKFVRIVGCEYRIIYL